MSMYLKCFASCIAFTAVITFLSMGTKVNAAQLSNQQQVASCSFDVKDNWWTAGYAAVPASVANNPVTKDPEFCEFYQFAQDWFLYLISPSQKAGLLNWEDPSQYPLLEAQGNSCDDNPSERSLFVRTAKANDAKQVPVWPERIDQAGENVHAIYDQNGNIVFYEVRFSINLCDYASIQKNLNFPGKTVELKLAWRILDDSESLATKESYYQTNAEINGTDYLLGLVGWHIVVSADNHPEMVWITLDHHSNAINCSDISASDSQTYAFTSSACAKDESNCQNLNQSLKSTAIKLPSVTKPNDICKAFPYGTLENQGIETDDGLNIALIKKLNNAMPQAFQMDGLPAGLDVWGNYSFKGALWVSDIQTPSTTASNQRGSLELANAVMETTFQGTAGQKGSSTNCFGCHQYNGNDKSNTGYQAFLSHIFDDIIDGQCQDIQTTTVVNNQTQANANCPTTCETNSKTPVWNGQWTNQDAKTGKQLPMTVCGCCPSKIVQ
ncbi:MAG: mannan-binding lectin [Acidiferrobacterales bacterium]|nr:mannan-binding lectin [Acidiferrobacterales bacterium]